MPNIAGIARRRSPSRSLYCAWSQRTSAWPVVRRTVSRELTAPSSRRRRAADAPVISDPRPARRRTGRAAATSSGVPSAAERDPREHRFARNARVGEARPRSCAVSTNVGATALTRIPCGASSSAIAFVRALDRVLGRAVDGAIPAADVAHLGGDDHDRPALAAATIRRDRAGARRSPARTLSAKSAVGGPRDPPSRNGCGALRAGRVDEHVDGAATAANAAATAVAVGSRRTRSGAAAPAARPARRPPSSAPASGRASASRPAAPAPASASRRPRRCRRSRRCHDARRRRAEPRHRARRRARSSRISAVSACPPNPSACEIAATAGATARVPVGRQPLVGAGLEELADPQAAGVARGAHRRQHVVGARPPCRRRRRSRRAPRNSEP